MTPLFVMLLAASTAADPVPVVQGPTTAAPVVTYSDGSASTTSGNRPRLFSRLRGLFRRNSPASEPVPVTYSTSTPNVWGSTAPPPAVTSTPVVTTTPVTTPALRPVPSAPPSQTAPAQKMPAGSPF
jgi:hypothetical protein